MKNYLLELANTKARDIDRGLSSIRNILNKPQHSLAAYVEYVNSLKLCKN
jgi:hypothetical protein